MMLTLDGLSQHTHTHTSVQVIAMAPGHEIWQRGRLSHHGGATRSYLKPASPQYGRTSPVYCEHCARVRTIKSPLVEGLPLSEGPALSKMDFLDEIDHNATLTG